jgi:hypothetical protein
VWVWVEEGENDTVGDFENDDVIEWDWDGVCDETETELEISFVMEMECEGDEE